MLPCLHTKITQRNTLISAVYANDNRKTRYDDHFFLKRSYFWIPNKTNNWPFL